MRNIAVVEDRDSDAKRLTEYIERFAKEEAQEFHIDRFASAADFLEGYRSVYAVVLMDIQMPKLNGMDGAMQLRRLDKTVSILFITNLVQYAQRGYEVDAVGFLVKPVQYYDFSLKFRKALDLYVMNEDFLSGDLRFELFIKSFILRKYLSGLFSLTFCVEQDDQIS